MRESSETDTGGKTEWGASDALILEGLSGLDQRFAQPSKEEDVPVEEATPVNGSGLDEAAAAAASNKLRSARELRAEQERMAALERSAVRRREGVTQALGMTPSQQTQAVEVAPTLAPKPEPDRVSLRKVDHAEVRVPSESPVAPAPLVRSEKPEVGKVQPEPLKKREELKEELSARPGPSVVTRAPLVEPRGPAREIGTERHDPEPIVRERMVTPQMEPTVRRRRAGSSFLPSILTSLFLTSLVWGAVLYTAWKFVGEEWFNTRVQEAAGALEGEQGEDVVKTLKQDIQNLDEELKLFRTSHQNFVRMNTLKASLWSDNSRQKYDEFVEIGERLETGSPEEDYFLETKAHMEGAYVQRVRQLPGLNTRKLFPNLNVSKDVSLGKATLLRFVSNQEGAGRDRARAALLLRKYEDDGEVMKQLRQTVRDDHDLEVVFAAWDSLLELSGYDPGALGFQPADFDRWWSLRGQ